jgi:serine/threonine protein kinase
MIDIFQNIHSIGYVYNDIKPENICVGFKNQEIDMSHKIKLVDFGLASKFIENGEHIK